MLRRTSVSKFACCQMAALHHSSSLFQFNHGNNNSSSVPDLTRPDTVFELRANHVKFGDCALLELGRDVASTFAKRVAVVTDRNVSGLEYFQEAMSAIKKAGVDVALYDECRCEPTDKSFLDCTTFLNEQTKIDAVISIGGGSVIDTAKAANLLSAHKGEASLLDFINAPIGLAKMPWKKLPPHIACPSTTGTGSECTTIAICDIISLGLKTGMSLPALQPSLAIVDPRLTYTMPKAVLAASGFDILCHAVESITARPFTMRPQLFPGDPSKKVPRPASQGSNPVSDSGAFEALRVLGRSYREAFASDVAGSQYAYDLAYASMMAGAAFGSSGVHQCHANGYPLAGKIKSSYQCPPGYPTHGGGAHPVLPHGVSVALTAPAVFRRIGASEISADMNSRLLRSAQLLDPENAPHYAKLVDPTKSGAGKICGEIVSGVLTGIMKELEYFPAGCAACGFTEADLPALTEGAMKQQRLMSNAPYKGGVTEELAREVFVDSMKLW